VHLGYQPRLVAGTAGEVTKDSYGTQYQCDLYGASSVHHRYAAGEAPGVVICPVPRTSRLGGRVEVAAAVRERVEEHARRVQDHQPDVARVLGVDLGDGRGPAPRGVLAARVPYET